MNVLELFKYVFRTLKYYFLTTWSYVCWPFKLFYNFILFLISRPNQNNNGNNYDRNYND